VQRVEVALDSRSLRDEAGLREHLEPGDPAAGLLELVLDRGRIHVRASCFLGGCHEGSPVPMPTLCQAPRCCCRL
jgi:hypothetical protein